MTPIWLGLLLGLGMGVLSGLGVGGGKLLVPVLVFFLGVTQKSAQGVALLALIPIALIAGFVHSKSGVVRKSAALWLIAGSLIGAVFGAYIAMHADNSLLQRMYGVFLSLVALYEMLNKEGTTKER